VPSSCVSCGAEVLPIAAVAISRALLAGERETVRALADVVLAQPVHGVTLSAATFPIYGDASRAGRELLAVERGLRDLGRDYDAACIALDAAGALEAAGDRVAADAARARATSLLESLGCVHPY
jgi:hypothetical protein